MFIQLVKTEPSLEDSFVDVKLPSLVIDDDIVNVDIVRSFKQSIKEYGINIQSYSIFLDTFYTKNDFPIELPSVECLSSFNTNPQYKKIFITSLEAVEESIWSKLKRKIVEFIRTIKNAFIKFNMKRKVNYIKQKNQKINKLLEKKSNPQKAFELNHRIQIDGISIVSPQDFLKLLDDFEKILNNSWFRHLSGDIDIVRFSTIVNERYTDEFKPFIEENPLQKLTQYTLLEKVQEWRYTGAYEKAADRCEQMGERILKSLVLIEPLVNNYKDDLTREDPHEFAPTVVNAAKIASDLVKTCIRFIRYMIEKLDRTEEYLNARNSDGFPD